MFYLYSLIIKPFYNLGPETLSITTANKKVLQGSFISSENEHAGDGIKPILLRKEFNCDKTPVK